VRTAVVSDLHLGAGSGADMLRRPEIAARLAAAIEGCERLVLLGDVVELRDRPLAEALDAARPVIAALAEALGDGELVIVAGNHDHHFVEPWLERRALLGAESLGLEQFAELAEGALAAMLSGAGAEHATIAYPGIWLRSDVYATHGHYLDRHLTVPTLERLGIAAVERVLGIPPSGPDPLAPPEDRELDEPEEYERVQTPVYAFLFALAQTEVGGLRGSANPSMRVWQMLAGGETRSAKLRGWLLGTVAVPGAIGVANRLGLGPVRPDLSANAIARAGVDGMAAVVEGLGIDARHVIFGHTHRRGPLAEEPGWEAGEARLWNTGSWVHSPALLGRSAADSPYWPGTVCFLEDDGDPRLVNLLEDLTRAELAGGDRSAGDAAP